MDRFQKGLETMKDYVTADALKQMVESDALADIAPDLRKIIVEFAYGDIYSRDGLGKKKRALVVITDFPNEKAHYGAIAPPLGVG